MLKIENTEVLGWEHAIRGMRNPKNSWEKSDSGVWYLAVSANAIGYDLETIMQMNVDKLKARYPDGFDAEHSLHRNQDDI